MKINPLVISIFFTIALQWSNSEASIVSYYEFEELVVQADGIVHGTVLSQTAVWENQSIVTYVEIELIDCLKGAYSPDETLLIRRHGGRIEDIVMHVSGSPGFLSGEEVILFLEHAGDNSAPLILGMAQGKFTVTTETGHINPVVWRSLQGLNILPQAGSFSLSLSVADPRLQSLFPVDLFLEEVRTILHSADR
jgi:hypothetical protein